MRIDSTVYGIMQIPGLVEQEELKYLCDLAATVSSWTEVGAWCGRSFYAVGLHLPHGALLQVIDNQLGLFQRANQTFLSTYVQLAQLRPDLRIVMLKMESRHCEDAACNTEAVFLDGNHTYEHVKADIAIWSNKAKLLLGHDYDYPDYPGVRQAVDEARTDPKYSQFEVTHSIWKLNIAQPVPTTIYSHQSDETPKENSLPPIATGSTSSNTPESRVNKPENSEQSPCIHRLSQPVGTLNCTCRSKPSVYRCQEPAIVSGFCMPDVPKTSSAGPVRLRTGELTTDRYVPHVLREGETPRPHEIVCCSSCPIRESP